MSDRPLSELSAAGFHPDLGRARSLSLAAGCAGSVAMLAGFAMNRDHFYQSYLLAFTLVTGVALGSLGLLMMQHLTGGAWGISIRRILEAAARTLPFLGILFLPLLAGMGRLYQWADPAKVAADPVLQQKSLYLNPTGFALRGLVFFALWSLLGWTLARWSAAQDAAGDPGLADKLARLSGGGVVLYVLTMTFASVDWLMSLEPHWFSTLYGFFTVMGQALSGLCFAILVLAALAAREPLSGRIGPRHFHDLGKLLLAFVLLWSYFAFSQLLIIWAGNLPEEIPWYLKRLDGGWHYLASVLVVLQFLAPFLLLLSAKLKQQPRRLAAVALFLLAMRWVDLVYIINPSFHPGGFDIHWMDVAAPVALGGLWMALLLRFLQARPVLPVGDPEIEAALEPHHG